MKRTLDFFSVAALVMLASGALLAQESPFVGTWKLDLSKSQFGTTPAPKSETRTVKQQGSGQNYTFAGVAADGSRIDYTFMTNLDGKPAPISGSGVPGNGDSVAIKRVNSNTDVVTVTKRDKVVGTLRVVVSEDGKVTTQTRKGTDANGQPVTQVMVWAKQ